MKMAFRKMSKQQKAGEEPKTASIMDVVADQAAPSDGVPGISSTFSYKLLRRLSE